MAQRGIGWILVAIQILSWILDHFPGFFVIIADRAKTDILQCISASYELIRF